MVASPVSDAGVEVGPAGVVMVVTPLKPVVTFSPSAQAANQHSAAINRNEPDPDDQRIDPRYIRSG